MAQRTHRFDRNALIVPCDKPAQAIERQGRVAGPEHPQTALDYQRRGSRTQDGRDDVVFTSHFVQGIAHRAVELFQRRQCRLEQIPRGRARGQPRQQLSAILLEPIFTDPLDQAKQEVDERIGTQSETPARAGVSRASGRPESHRPSE